MKFEKEIENEMKNYLLIMFRRAINNPFVVKSSYPRLIYAGLPVQQTLNKRNFSFSNRFLEQKPLKEDPNIVVPKKYLEELERKVNAIYQEQQQKKQEEEKKHKDEEEYANSYYYKFAVALNILSNGFWMFVVGATGAHPNPLASLAVLGCGVMGLVPDWRVQLTAIILPWFLGILLSY